METRVNDHTLTMVDRPGGRLGGPLILAGVVLAAVGALVIAPGRGAAWVPMTTLGCALLALGIAANGYRHTVTFDLENSYVDLSHGFFGRSRIERIPRDELLYFSLPREAAHTPVVGSGVGSTPISNDTSFVAKADYEVILVATDMRAIPILRTRDFDLYHQVKLWLRDQAELPDLDGYAKQYRRQHYNQQIQ